MQERKGTEDVQDVPRAGFAIGFLDGVTDANFRAIAIGGDAAAAVGDFVGDLGGHNHAVITVLVEDAEGLAVNFGDAGDSGRTIRGWSIYSITEMTN